MPKNQCELCETVAQARAGQHSRLIHEFEHSFLIVGPHQRFTGYCVLVAKDHVREPFELPEAAMTELLRAARAIERAFKPWKLNYSCYGNQVPHVHWHLFPRYEGDPMLKSGPWAQETEFAKHPTTEAQAREAITQIKRALCE